MSLYKTDAEAQRPVSAAEFDHTILRLMGMIGAQTALFQMLFVGRALVEGDPRGWFQDRLKEALEISAQIGLTSALGEEAKGIARDAAEKLLKAWGDAVDRQIKGHRRMDAAGEPTARAQ